MCHTIALDIYDWDENGKSGQVHGEKEVFEGSSAGENMDTLESAEEGGVDSCKGSGEVSGNPNSKVKPSSAEDCCSQDEVESSNLEATTEDIADEIGSDMEKVNTVSGTVKIQAGELEISPLQLLEKGSSLVWAECPGESWFPAILPKPSALSTLVISYILPFPAKPATNLVQLFDSEGSWKRVEVVEPLGEDREVDEMRLRAEG